MFQRQSLKCAEYLWKANQGHLFVYAKGKKISAKRNEMSGSFKLFIKLNELRNLFPENMYIYFVTRNCCSWLSRKHF